MSQNYALRSARGEVHGLNQHLLLLPESLAHAKASLTGRSAVFEASVAPTANSHHPRTNDLGLNKRIFA